MAHNCTQENGTITSIRKVGWLVLKALRDTRPTNTSCTAFFFLVTDDLLLACACVCAQAGGDLGSLLCEIVLQLPVTRLVGGFTHGCIAIVMLTEKDNDFW